MRPSGTSWIRGAVGVVAPMIFVAGCTGSDTHHATATDTTTVTTPVRDTTVVKKDTTITVDTLKKTTHGKKK